MATAPITANTSPLVKLTKFFGVTLAEFQTFYRTLTDDEKMRFKSEVEAWDGQTEFVPAK